MAKYKAYPEYKDSGVEWLGEIPDHWTTLAIKHVAQINPSKSCISIEKMKGMCSFIPMEKLKFNSLSLDEVKDVSDVYNGYTYFENEDILIAKVTPCFENKNMVVAHDLHNGIGFGSSEIYILRCNDIINNNFLFYRLQEDNFMSIAEGAMTGAGGLKRVPSELLNNFKFGLPGKKEQSIIVNFLKHETAKIDNLIEKQQQLIELLKEKRQAVISHAVTKGLDPDVQMKDSGVEWLGDVPEHWEVKRIKHFGKVIGGFAFKSTDFTDEGYPVIKISNVSHLSFDWGDSSFLPPSFSFTHKEYLAPNGALVFAMTRPVISGGIKVTLLDDDSAPLVNQRVGFMMVRSKNMARYILISTQSSAFLAHFVNNMTVTNQPNISSEGIESIYLPVPPMNEISRILLYVDRMNESYNQLIDRALLQVSLLQERRTALISAAVTGKIDVRDWVAPDTQDIEEPQEATA
ncbi:restriction endonuclease subunit S [Pantoea vagans]|uniref:restriction endonuclease subunit S n=1 Tax=Pantoea vagans TaxID=470934 RepID=UPI0010936FED|nr:restriction endonuclease subunit S [Pantoea vagans]QCA05666.1 restriction endonuclease subunit S [Pantoea vagans]